MAHFFVSKAIGPDLQIHPLPEEYALAIEKVLCIFENITAFSPLSKTNHVVQTDPVSAAARMG